MTIQTKKAEFRQSTAGKKLPRAVADAAAGIIVAVADIDGPPERVFDALTRDEVVRWWMNAQLYRTAEFNHGRANPSRGSAHQERLPGFHADQLLGPRSAPGQGQRGAHLFR